MSDTPAGWYLDPTAPYVQRYWDGQAWTENTAPVAPPLPDEYSPAPLATRGGRYLVLSILMLVCCSPIAGIVALVFSIQSRTAAARGDALEADKYDSWAKTALIIGVIVTVLYIGMNIILNASNAHTVPTR